jgi:two-component system, OmpR family, phosphate regulon sensor histidine kinase PhoR
MSLANGYPDVTIRTRGAFISGHFFAVIPSPAGAPRFPHRGERTCRRNRAHGLEQFEAVSGVFDALDIVLYVADFDTHELLFLNARGEELWGSGQLGRRCYEVLQAGQGGPCAFCTNHRLVEGGQARPQARPPVAWEFQNTVTGRWFLCIDKAIRWRDGRLVRMEVAIDITERKAHEWFQEQYVGLISHDLRAPLSTIAASASALESLLEHHQLDASQGARALGAILRSTRRMSEMIEDLLETTRLESGSIQLHVAQLDLAELATSVIASFPDGPSRPIRLKAAEPVTVMADAGRLERVLENLIGNAIRYSPAGTPVQVEVAKKEDETVVTVADRGLGIPPPSCRNSSSGFIEAPASEALRRAWGWAFTPAG